MAKRGRPKKSQELTVPVVIDHDKLLKQFEQEQRVQLETLYKELAVIRKKVDLALTQIHSINSCDILAEAVFKAGRAYGPLDEANDKLEEMLEEIYGNHDFDHYDDIFNN